MIDTSVTYNGEDIFQEMTFKDRVESFFKILQSGKIKRWRGTKDGFENVREQKRYSDRTADVSVRISSLSTFSNDLSMISTLIFKTK